MNRMMLRLLLLNLWWVSWVVSIAAAVLPSIITRTAVAAFSYSSQQHPQLPPYSIINTSRKDTTRSSTGNAVEHEKAAAAAEDDNEDPSSSSPSPSPAPSKYWIVLVDDEESIRLAVGDYLFSSSQAAAAAASSSEESASDHALLTYDVSAASDSTSLLQLIVSQQQQPQRHAPSPSPAPAHDDDTHTSSSGKKKKKNQTYWLPDLIISDVRMPESEKNGYELVEYIRSGGTTTATKNNNENNKNNENSRSSRSNYIVDISQTTVTMEETETIPGDDRVVVQAVVAQLQNVPIILLTAKAMTEDRIRGYKAGADIIIPKPFAPQELLSCVNTILTQRQVRTDYYTKQQQEQQQQQLQQQHDATDASSSSSSSSLTNDATSAVQALRHEIDAIHAIVERTTKRGTTYVERTDVVLSDKERTFVACLAAGATMTEIIRQQSSPSLSPPSTTSTTIITSKQKEDYTRVLQKLYDKTRTTTKTELLRWSRRVGYISET